MSDVPSAPQPTPTNYQRTTGGSHLRWQPPTPEHLQEMLPAYEILSILGQGGMGAVYKGRQKSLDRIVAIKILPPEAGEDDMQFVERFKNEARTMAKMNHPAIVHVYDFGETTEGQLFIVMEFIDGTDVAKMIQEKKKLPEDYALAITAHVCDALGYAHTQGVVHRDIKPANILINMDGQVKVADFGLAKATDPSQMGLTKTNMAMGTPDFVSPEALMPGVPLDGRADLYAMGVMLFNMLTGTIPRGAFRMPSITHQTDARFDKIIGKAMEMDRELRYQTALELRRDLDVILTTPAAKTGMQTIPAQPAAAPQSLPHKPMGKSPSAPQQQRSADAPIRKEPTGKPAPAPVPKSNAGMIYSIAAAVVLGAVAVFMFAGGGKKLPEVKPVAESKPESPQPASPPKPAPADSTTTSTAPLSKSSEILTFGGHRYQLLTEKMTWDVAKTKAMTMGGHLVTITSKAEADFVRDKLLPQVLGLTQNVGMRRLLLGAQKTSPNTPWEWVSGERFDLSQWVGMQSDPKGTESHYLNWDYGAKRWDHSSARMEYFPLIEWDDDGSSKPGEIIAFGDHRYQLVTENIKWDDAYNKAKAMGGTLAVITTREESDQLTTALKDKIPGGGAWIGGVMKDDSTWSWVTGESFDFTRWGDGQPDRSGRSMIMTVKGTWDDAPGAMPRSCYIVEWNDGGTSKPTPVPAAPAGAINLLGLVDVKRDAVAGDWTMMGKELVLAKGIYGALEFQTAVPEEYDFEMEFTPQTDGNNVNQYISAGGHSFAWKLNAHARTPPLYGFELLDGKFAKDTTEARTEISQALQVGTRYRSTIEVRKASLRALLDGKELVKWSGDFSRFSMENGTKLRDPKHIGVGAYKRGVIFHKAEVRPPAAVGEAVPPSGSGPVRNNALPKTVMPAVVPAPPADPRLAQLEAGYQARYESDAQKPFLAAVATLNQSYVANGISRARAAAQAKGSLTEVTALDAEKAAIEKGGGVPAEDAADTPESLKALRGTYRGALAKISAERDAKAAPLLDLYLKALDVYVAELTKAGKIDEAKQVQTLRDDKAAQKTAEVAKAAPAPKSNAAPALATKNAKKLFNGTNTEGWRYQGPQEAFVVEDGCIKVAGPRGNLMFMGNRDVSPIMKDFDLSMKVKTEGKANSGVFIHCRRNNDGSSFVNGLELQIANENQDPQKTGSVWGVQPVNKLIVHDGEWFDYRITVRGMTVTTFINGKEVNEWTQPADWNGAPGKPEAKLGEGTIGLQSNGGTVWFKSIEITVP